MLSLLCHWADARIRKSKKSAVIQLFLGRISKFASSDSSYSSSSEVSVSSVSAVVSIGSISMRMERAEGPNPAASPIELLVCGRWETTGPVIVCRDSRSLQFFYGVPCSHLAFATPSLPLSPRFGTAPRKAPATLIYIGGQTRKDRTRGEGVQDTCNFRRVGLEIIRMHSLDQLEDLRSHRLEFAMLGIVCVI